MTAKIRLPLAPVLVVTLAVASGCVVGGDGTDVGEDVAPSQASGRPTRVYLAGDRALTVVD